MKSKFIAILMLLIFYLPLSSVEAKQIDDVITVVAPLELLVAESELDLASTQSDLALSSLLESMGRTVARHAWSMQGYPSTFPPADPAAPQE